MSIYDIKLISSSLSQQTVLESAYAHDILKEYYINTCDNLLEQRSSKSPYVQQSLLQIMPRLAAFNREVFVSKYLKTCVTHLLTILRGKEKDRNVAYITIGCIAVAVGNDIKTHLKDIMAIIKQALPAKELTSKRKPPVDAAVFACITLLAHAVKSQIADDVRDILEQMFQTGLSPALTVCLRELAENVPELKPFITEGLIGVLFQVLMNKNAVIPYATMPPISIEASLLQASDSATIVLALKTLGTFNFEDQNMLDFVQR